MSSGDLSRCVDRGDLLEAVRGATGRSDVELEEGGVEVKRATKGVEGFLSLVLRVRVPYRLGDGTRHEVVLVAKCMPVMDVQLDIVKTTRAFPREGTFFREVFPLLRKASGGKVDLPMPTCYHAKYGGDDDAIYMEDLGARGFRTPAVAFRTSGLDMEHCRLAMEAYGRLHALTMAAERLLPENVGGWMQVFPELSTDPMFLSPRPGKFVPFKGMFDVSTETLLDIAKGMDGLPGEAAASGKLRGVMGNFWKILQRMVKPESNAVKVLSHGDCWMNNSMFRYEKVGEGSKPVEMKLIDFQIVRYCHPCVDIVYFLYASIRKSFRQKHMEGLIRIYYESLGTSLRAMNFGSPPFTLEEFINDFHGVYESLGIIFEAVFMPLVYLGEEYAPSNAEELTSEKYNEFITTGNSSAVRVRYAKDSNFRLEIEEVISDLVDYIFPNGVNSPISPLFKL